MGAKAGGDGGGDEEATRFVKLAAKLESDFLKGLSNKYICGQFGDTFNVKQM